MADERPPLSVTIRATEEGLAEVALSMITPDKAGYITAPLTPYMALVVGHALIHYGVTFGTLNESLIERPIEDRKEILELHAQFNLPDALDSPFDPPVH